MKALDDAPPPWRHLGGIALSLACTGAGFLLHPPLSLTNVVLIYVLGAAVAGLRLGRAAAALTALLNVALFNYCFVPPRSALRWPMASTW